MNVSKLEKLARKLAHLSQLLSAGAATAFEADSFYKTLDDVMALTPLQETIVEGMTLSGLDELGDRDTRQWLAEELDVECTLQQLPDARGFERACLLFALPVVLSPTDTVSTYADQQMLEDAHQVLVEADVIDPAANFGLVGRLFSYEALFSRSYGQLKRLNQFLAQQVLQGAQTLVMPEDFPVEELDGAGCNPYASLFFVLGSVTTKNADLENVFPPLPTEEDEREGGFEREKGYQMTEAGAASYDMAESGSLEGEPWEQAFCEAFDNAWGTMEGSYTVIPPDGICEDLRRGLEVAREVGTERMFAMELPSDGRDKWARLSYLQESEGHAWFDVSCLAAPEVEPLATVRWQVFNHECAEHSLEKLTECLTAAGVQLEGPGPIPCSPLGSMLLH